MGTQPRPLAPGACYHVYPHLHELVEPFDDDDRTLLLRLLAVTVESRGWRLWAYCLMGTHLHLVLQTPAGDLDGGMRDFLSGFALRRNRYRGTRGAIWNRPYGAKLLRRERHAMAAIRYVPLNPVAAGLCAHPSDWPWSSHRFTTGEFPSPPWLSTGDVHDMLAGGGPELAARAYATLMSSANDANGIGLPIAPVAPFLPPPMRPVQHLLTNELGDPGEIAAAYFEGHSLSHIAAALQLSPTTIARRMKTAGV